MSATTTELEPLQANPMFGREIEIGREMNDDAVVAAMDAAARRLQPQVEPAAAPASPTRESRVRARLLAIADGYLRAGSLHQAIEMYFDLIAAHPETPEADMAEERTLEVASVHEQNGEMRMARAIYERLV